MKIYVVSSECTVFIPSRDHTGGEEEHTQSDVESCFKFKNAAENYIHNKITQAENMCLQNPVVHQGFVRSQWGCNWLDLYNCEGSLYSQRFFVSYSIKELEL